ncbi:threonine--tRNA ligase [Patescibacteria group bacterium]|nr:threonine--tRNA ligase [Patescibacteria group bacterium]
MSKNNQPTLEIKRHSLSHILAAAVLEMFPEAKLGIGPAIDTGFYYDFELPRTLIPEDLPLLEEKMKSLISQNLPFEKEVISIPDALSAFEKANQPYKIELINELKKEGEDEVIIYRTGSFVDLCSGPHVESSGELNQKSFSLEKTSGAYWRGDEKNPMLQRIYGLAFDTPKELRTFVALKKEAAKRDHRKLGKELDLFTFSDLIGPGLPLYTPKGFIVRNEIINYSRELNTKIGYEEVHTPNINKAELFKVSGHYEKYKDDMLEVHSHYTEEKYYLKPMNCPQHTQIFAAKKRSYKDLPLRFSDFANVYRDEKPGELAGLTRLKYFAVDDGHCFCSEDQVKDEFIKVMDVITEALKTYGLTDYSIRLSLRDPEKKEKYIGDDTIWDESESLLRDLLTETNITFKEEIGEAAFYGPKVDIIVKDCLMREWQICTVQIDKNMPERFDLTYIDKDGTERRPVMIHRGIIGSAERLMAILIEEYAGKFPVWLAPYHVKVLSVSEKVLKETHTLVQTLKDRGLRIEEDLREESVGKKIADAIKDKVPYIVVLGEKEAKSGNIAVRKRDEKEIKEYSVDDFATLVKDDITKRTIF